MCSTFSMHRKRCILLCKWVYNKTHYSVRYWIKKLHEWNIAIFCFDYALLIRSVSRQLATLIRSKSTPLKFQKWGFRHSAAFEVDLNQRVKEELSVYYGENEGDWYINNQEPDPSCPIHIEVLARMLAVPGFLSVDCYQDGVQKNADRPRFSCCYKDSIRESKPPQNKRRGNCTSKRISSSFR